MTPPGPRKPTPPPTPPRPRSSFPIDDTPDEDKTPVTSDPFVSLDHRSRLTREAARETLSVVKGMHSKVHDMDRKLETYVEIDQRDHENLRRDNERTASALDNVADRVNKLDNTVSNIGGKMDMVLDHVQSMRRIEEHKTKVTIETRAHVERAQTDAAVDEQKTKGRITLKILGIIGALLGSGGLIATVIAALAGKC